MKQEAIQKKYDAQVRRILKRIAEIEDEGYLVDPQKYIRDLKRPSRQSVERLRKITPKFLREHSNVVVIETGEIIPPRKTKKTRQKRKEALQKYAIHSAEQVTIKFPKQSAETKTQPTAEDRQLAKIDKGLARELDKEDPTKQIDKGLQKELNKEDPIKQASKGLRKEADKEKRAYNASKTVVDNFLHSTENLAPQIVNVIKSIVGEAIAKSSYDAVAEALMSMPPEIIDDFQEAYDPSGEETLRFRSFLMKYVVKIFKNENAEEQLKNAYNDIDLDESYSREYLT